MIHVSCIFSHDSWKPEHGAWSRVAVPTGPCCSLQAITSGVHVQKMTHRIRGTAIIWAFSQLKWKRTFMFTVLTFSRQLTTVIVPENPLVAISTIGTCFYALVSAVCPCCGSAWFGFSLDMWVWGSGPTPTLNPPSVFILPTHIA